MMFILLFLGVNVVHEAPEAKQWGHLKVLVHMRVYLRVLRGASRNIMGTW